LEFALFALREVKEECRGLAVPTVRGQTPSAIPPRSPI